MFFAYLEEERVHLLRLLLGGKPRQHPQRLHRRAHLLPRDVAIAVAVEGQEGLPDLHAVAVAEELVVAVLELRLYKKKK